MITKASLWRLRQYFPPKRCQPSTRLQDVTSPTIWSKCKVTGFVLSWHVSCKNEKFQWVLEHPPLTDDTQCTTMSAYFGWWGKGREVFECVEVVQLHVISFPLCAHTAVSETYRTGERVRRKPARQHCLTRLISCKCRCPCSNLTVAAFNETWIFHTYLPLNPANNFVNTLVFLLSEAVIISPCYSNARASPNISCPLQLLKHI